MQQVSTLLRLFLRFLDQQQMEPKRSQSWRAFPRCVQELLRRPMRLERLLLLHQPVAWRGQPLAFRSLL